MQLLCLDAKGNTISFEKQDPPLCAKDQHLVNVNDSMHNDTFALC